MNFYVSGAVTAAALCLSAGTSLAATIVLDSFDTPQIVVDQPYFGTSTTSTIAYGAGTRTLTVETTGPSSISATVLESTDGSLQFSNKNQATGKATLTYTALGDISNGANPYFFFDVGYFDNVALFGVSATDGLGNTSTYSEVLSPGFSPFLYFSQFTGIADFNDIAELTFTLDTTNVPGFGAVVSVDGSLNAISYAAPVPLPATALLLLGAVGGLGGLRSLKRRKTA